MQSKVSRHYDVRCSGDGQHVELCGVKRHVTEGETGEQA